MKRCKIIRPGGIDAALPGIEGTHHKAGEELVLDELVTRKWAKRGWIEILESLPLSTAETSTGVASLPPAVPGEVEQPEAKTARGRAPIR